MRAAAAGAPAQTGEIPSPRTIESLAQGEAVERAYREARGELPG